VREGEGKGAIGSKRLIDCAAAGGDGWMACFLLVSGSFGSKKAYLG